MDELIRRVDVARPLLEKYREAKRQAERARKLRNLGSCLAVSYTHLEDVADIRESQLEELRDGSSVMVKIPVIFRDRWQLYPTSLTIWTAASFGRSSVRQRTAQVAPFRMISFRRQDLATVSTRCV